MYEFGKSKVSNGKQDSDACEDEKVEEPKPKIARYDNETLNEGPCDSTKNGEPKSNGSTGPELPLKKKTYESDEIDFVSVDWITQWLDPGNPVPPVENGMLTCDHKKLAPPLPNSNPCLYRIIPAPLVRQRWFRIVKVNSRQPMVVHSLISSVFIIHFRRHRGTKFIKVDHDGRLQICVISALRSNVEGLELLQSWMRIQKRLLKL